MEQKKLTRDQLERRMKNAIMFVPKDKSYKGLYLVDKGLKVEITSDKCIISTNYHSHVFNVFVAGGQISKPYLYAKTFCDIVVEADCKADGGYSFIKTLEELNKQEDKFKYNIATYFEMWVYNCFQPLYSISEGDTSSFLVFEDYLHNIARNAILLDEKKEDMTNVQFIDNVIENMKEFSKGNKEFVVLHKLTDEEMMKQSMDATTEELEKEEQ